MGTPHHFFSNFDSASEPSVARAKDAVHSSVAHNFRGLFSLVSVSSLVSLGSFSSLAQTRSPFPCFARGLNQIMDHAQGRETASSFGSGHHALELHCGNAPLNFEPAIEWDDQMGDPYPRYGRPNQSQRHLHTFVPLPSSKRFGSGWSGSPVPRFGSTAILPLHQYQPWWLTGAFQLTWW